MAKDLLENAVMIMPTAGGSFSRDQVREDPIATNSKMGLYTNHCNLLDMSAIALPENSLDREYPFGITAFASWDSENLLFGFGQKFMEEESLKLAVCGLHKKGRELESQIVELGGRFVEHAKTRADYKVYQLNTKPQKPGMIKVKEGGGQIDVDIYSIPKKSFGYFMDRVLPPHTIGSISLESGEVVKSFLCESWACT